MPKPPGHGVTREQARKVVDLAKRHGLEHVHPLLTDPDIKAKNIVRRIEALEEHGIHIGYTASAEEVRAAYRAVFDLGLLPEGYPHELSKSDRKKIIGHMREHGVGTMQEILKGKHHPSRAEYYHALPR